MTRKERAITNLKQMCSDGRYLGSGSYVPLEVLEDFNLAIKALEQEPTTKIEESNFSQEQYLADIQSAYDCGKSVIDKIRAEIEEYQKDAFYSNDVMMPRKLVLSIIDKYKSEIEPQESEAEDGKYR